MLGLEHRAGAPDDFLVGGSISALYTDEHSFKKDSPWKNWQPSGDLSLLSIFVLEKLGKSYFLRQDESQGEEREDFQRAILLPHIAFIKIPFLSIALLSEPL
jgi:hypothetical protein